MIITDVCKSLTTYIVAGKTVGCDRNIFLTVLTISMAVRVGLLPSSKRRQIFPVNSWHPKHSNASIADLGNDPTILSLHRFYKFYLTHWKTVCR